MHSAFSCANNAVIAETVPEGTNVSFLGNREELRRLNARGFGKGFSFFFRGPELPRFRFATPETWKASNSVFDCIESVSTALLTFFSDRLSKASW